jgi:hypothetical protein
LHGRGTGIGPALRKARLHRGKSLEEASRETRIGPHYLQALEREEFDALLGEVYVRGFLRTYATYLGLNPDRVLAVYSRSAAGPSPFPPAPPVPASRLPVQDGHPSLRSRLSLRLVGVVGVVILGLLAVGLGLFSRSGVAPGSAPLPSEPPSVEALAPTVTVAVEALEPVELVVGLDGVESTYSLREGEARSFEAADEVSIRLERGETVRLTVNGHPVGIPGEDGAPFEDSFGPGDFREDTSENGN